MSGIFKRYVHIHIVGLRLVARFDKSGNARSLTLWNEQQVCSTFFVYVCQ